MGVVGLALIYSMYCMFSFPLSSFLGGTCLNLRHKLLNLDPWKKLRASYTSISCWKKEVIFFSFDILDLGISSQTFLKLFDSAIFLCNCVVLRGTTFSGGCLKPALHVAAVTVCCCVIKRHCG